MRLLRGWMARIAGMMTGRRRDREFSEELASHLQLHTDENIRAGMSSDEAGRAARIHLGGLDVAREQYRDRRGLPILETIVQDLRYAVRTLRRSPGFTAAAVATLALGIGGTTAVFSIVDATLVRPLPYREPERLVAIQETNRIGAVPVNALHFREWRSNVQAFEGLSLLRQVDMNLTDAGEPELISAARVSADFFRILGVQPSLGRSFAEEEDRVGRDRVVVINDALWRRKFDADPRILGRRVTLDGQPYEVIGVMPPSFVFPRLTNLYAAGVTGDEPEIWKPFAATPDELTLAGYFSFASIGRLRAGVTAEQATTALNVVQAAIGAQIPGYTLGATVIPLQDQIVRRSRAGLQLLLTAISIVLVIACVNITNLVFVRSAARSREVAVRVALGATRRRLIRQLLVESFALSAAGGVVGLAIAFGLMPVVVRYAPPEMPRLHEIAIDARIFAFATALSVLTGVVVGLVPAWRFSSTRGETPSATLRTRSAQATRGAFRTSLVGVEVAATAMCLIVCGLLLNSFIRLLSVDPGFAVERVLTLELRLPRQRFADPAARSAFVQRVVDRLESLHGVMAAGASSGTPLTGTGAINGVLIEGSTAPQGQRPSADTRQATPRYFEATGTPLKAGRLFTDADRRPVAVVSSTAAAHLWPGQDAVGKRFRLSVGPLFEVIGVVGDIRSDGLDRPALSTVYLPTSLGYAGSRVAFHVRTSGDDGPSGAVIAQAIRELDADLAIPAIRMMEDIVSASVAQRRFQLTLIIVFAVLATALASVGIYGVASQAVAQRTSEFGIRVALGARAGQIRALVLRQGAAPVLAGLAVGIILAMLAGRFVSSMLYEVRPTDGVTIGTVVGLLILVSGAAMHLPARRATRVDPMIALRAE